MAKTARCLAGPHSQPAPIGPQAWGAELGALAAGTLIASGDSWYTGANIPGKPRSFMVHLNYPGYVAKCDAVAKDGYSAFVLVTKK